jgi:hypothetical protein
MVKRPITPFAELGTHTARHMSDRLAEKRAQTMMSAPVRQSTPVMQAVPKTPAPTSKKD